MLELARRVELCAVLPAVGLLSVLSGCTAILDTSRAQCEADADCTDLFGAETTHVCVSHVCERPFCDDDKSCRDRGGRFASSICDTAQHQCVEAECRTVDGCGSSRACNLQTNRCERKQCSITQECITQETESPSMQCVGGFCVDESWGCIGEPDNRPHQPGEKGTLRVPLFNPLTNGPLEGSDWHTTVCPVDDTRCAVPLDVPTAYDPATGIVTVEQLDSDQPVWLQFTLLNLPEPGRINGKAAVDMDFITLKPPVGVTTTPPLRVVTWAWIAKLVESYVQGGVITGSTESLGRVFVYGRQTIFGDAFDCQDKPAANMYVMFKDQTGRELVAGNDSLMPGIDYTPYFWDEQNIAYQQPTRNFTFGTGVWSTANLPTQVPIFLRSHLVVDGRTKSRVVRENVPVFMNAARMMTVHLYPRQYGSTQSR